MRALGCRLVEHRETTPVGAECPPPQGQGRKRRHGRERGPRSLHRRPWPRHSASLRTGEICSLAASRVLKKCKKKARLLPV
jgi:hypothetical protein